MTCSSVDLKAYMLGETPGESAGCEDHLRACDDCREELDRLRLTHAALLSAGEEEIPRRIAFVSDRVFERPWWQTVWASGPAMGFASAMVLAGAILAHGFATTRPAPMLAAHVAAPAAVAAPLDTASMERRIEAEVERREDAKHRELKLQGAALAAAQETIRMYQNQMGRMMVAANYPQRTAE